MSESISYPDPTGWAAAANVDRREKIMAHVALHSGATIPSIARELRLPRYVVFTDLTALVAVGRLALGVTVND